jgi:hypothetical protein
MLTLRSITLHLFLVWGPYCIYIHRWSASSYLPVMGYKDILDYVIYRDKKHASIFHTSDVDVALKRDRHSTFAYVWEKRRRINTAEFKFQKVLIRFNGLEYCITEIFVPDTLWRLYVNFVLSVLNNLTYNNVYRFCQYLELCSI